MLALFKALELNIPNNIRNHVKHSFFNSYVSKIGIKTKDYKRLDNHVKLYFLKKKKSYIYFNAKYEPEAPLLSLVVKV